MVEEIFLKLEVQKFFKFPYFNSNKIVDSPSPTNYNAKSDFNSTATSKAFSFGIAREAYSKVYIKENPKSDPTIPGPG